MSARQPLPLHVAVVVPVYGTQAWVGAALESVRAQTHPSWECVVVDDGSPDDAVARVLEVVDGDPRFTLVRQANAGLSAARNAGLAAVSDRAGAVSFLDSDDVLVPEALEVLAAALEADPAAAGAWGWAELLDEHGAPLSPGLHPARQRDRRRLRGWRLEAVAAGEPLGFDEVVVVGPVWPPAVALHRRAAVDATGSFDTSLRQLEDWDFYLREVRTGHLAPVQRQVAWYRQHGAQMTKRTAENVLWTDVVRRKAWAAAENTPQQRRSATRAWRQLQVRRTGRSAQRLLAAARRGRVREAASLAVGTAVLAAQNFAPGPPRAREWHVQAARRTV